VSFNSDGSLADQSTYYLTNLKDATNKVKGRWNKEYQFSQEWKARQLNIASLEAVYSEIRTEQKAREQWVKLYDVSSAAAKIPPGQVGGLYCAIVSLDEEAYKSCYCKKASVRDKQ